MVAIHVAKALRRLQQVARTPTAPFHEHRVLALVRTHAERLGLAFRQDAFGNARVVYENPPIGAAGEAMVRAPFVAVAHTDHPGFEVVGRDGRRRVEAVWMGGVRPDYFRGAKVVMFARGEIHGEIDEIRLDAERRVERLWIRTRSDRPAPGDPGAFALPAFRQDTATRKVEGRALDDLAGVAALLSALQGLVEAQAEGVLWCVFTRAEEVGFVGASAACQEGWLPRGARVVSVETSAESAAAKQGEGPVVRVGDRASVFDPTTVASVDAVAAELGRAGRRFRHQRALMSGGACEATLFARRGYATAGLALPLRNYHNMGVRRLQPESIHTDDYLGLVRLLAALAQRGHEHVAAVAGDADALGARLRTAAERWTGHLRETAAGPAGRAAEAPDGTAVADPTPDEDAAAPEAPESAS